MDHHPNTSIDTTTVTTTTNTTQICIFGLSGDPPTGYGGHVGIVSALQQMYIFDEIWVLPVYHHTFVEKQQRLVSYEHRYRMCELAFLHLNQDQSIDINVASQNKIKSKVLISNAEYLSWKYAVQNITNDDEKLKISVGTAALLDYLYISYPKQQYEFYFVLGVDSFLDLAQCKWQHSQRILNELLSNSNYICDDDEEIKMPKSTSSTIQQQQIHQYPSQWKRRLIVLHRASDDNTTDTIQEQEKERLLQQYVQDLGVRLLYVPQLGSISSTQIRNQYTNDELIENFIINSNSRMILPQVVQYMQKNSLYQFSNS